MVRLNWTDQSVDDLINIAEFIARDSVKYSVIQVKRIRERAKFLRNLPLAGRIVPETESEFVRELIVGSYRTFIELSQKQGLIF